MTFRRWIIILIAGGLLMCVPGNAPAQDRTESANKVKAAFLLNFLKFIEWPPQSKGAGCEPEPKHGERRLRMKPWLRPLVCGLFLFSSGLGAQQGFVYLASTIGPIDAGIVGALEDASARSALMRIKPSQMLIDRPSG